MQSLFFDFNGHPVLFILIKYCLINDLQTIECEVLNLTQEGITSSRRNNMLM